MRTDRNGREALRRGPSVVLGGLLAASLVLAAPSRAGEEGGAAKVEAALETLRRVGSEGSGNEAARAAWREVAAAPSSALPSLLRALDGAGPLAANWIRGAVDAVAERALERGGALPAAELEKFVRDRERAPRARRLAYEWLTRVDPGAGERLIALFLDDPSVELRREAVERVLAGAREQEKLADREGAAGAYEKALLAARDKDQIDLCAKKLRELGRAVDLVRHFGFLRRWHLAGPFDNAGAAGFDRAYPPEGGVDLAAEHEGKEGPVRWRAHASEDEYGVVDLNQALGTKKDVLAYAFHEFASGEERDVEIRLSTVNAWKLWLNGELLFARNEYHRGTEVDHYRVRGRLRAGRNEILLKVCQNAQTQDWAVHWRFQLRVCDAAGTAVLAADRLREDDAKDAKDARE